ncbi:gluconokinase [Alginatibacterium sediminis]|uniref:Gluconokinase n=1 Tax=Alginatibacterium sediminis TaxID=2164068 RepID=A0A420EDD7_9ALTE|nr:gluconokinase [Alginatibacterium sediminis]RKF18642.1 gluconokinase [Alginatibacterium sediminis]
MAKVYVVMGVSGCGKSSVGAALAERLTANFVDGDDLHPPANIEKMSQGLALNDSDRQPWLEQIRLLAHQVLNHSKPMVIVCSALKLAYRDLLRQQNDHLAFIFLQGSQALIEQRHRARHNHFMPTQLLQSQFDTLETPEPNEARVFAIDIDTDFDTLVERCEKAVQL